MKTAKIVLLHFLLVFVGLLNFSNGSPSVDFDDEEEQNFFRLGNNGTEQLRKTMKKCVPGAECVKHSDCARKEWGGGQPAAKLLLTSGIATTADARHFCRGIRVGKCDCTVCKTYRRCNSDKACGGLIGSCKATGQCDCFSAARRLYAADHLRGQTAKIAAYTQLCYTDNCQNTDDCFGLPCLKGECVCAR